MKTRFLAVLVCMMMALCLLPTLAMAAPVSTQAELDAAINNIPGGGGTGTIELDAGTYTLPAIQNKSITFKGVLDSKISLSSTGYHNSELVFDGVTLELWNSTYKGFQHSSKVVFKNCKLNGFQLLYSPEAEFLNCTLTNKGDYCLWTYGANTATFTNCVFETGGKAVNVYNEHVDFEGNYTFNNCTFRSDGSLTTTKPAVQASIVKGSENIYRLTFTNCTQEGFAELNSNSPLWGNKDSMKINEKLFVTIINEPEAPATVYSAPKTGDASQPMLWAMLAMLSAASMLVISRKRSAHSK